MPNVIQRAVWSNIPTKFPNHFPVDEQIDEGKNHRCWLLHSQQPHKWPLANNEKFIKFSKLDDFDSNKS